MTKLCEYCYGNLKPLYTASKDDHTVKVYRCEVCGKNNEDWYYKYNPQNCPKHHWIFDHRVFMDDPHAHSINMVFICDRCGARHYQPQDTKDAGVSGRVEIEHPKVWRTLALNKAVAKRMFTQEDFNDFWKDADKELVM